MTGGKKDLADTILLQDEAPTIDALTAYDEAHMAIYLQLLYGKAQGHSVSRLASDVFRTDADAEPARARKMVNSHLRRAKWLCEDGRLHFLARPIS